jgi:hypothetical protein
MGNPNPIGWSTTNDKSYYTVTNNKDECLWNIAKAKVQQDQLAAGKQELTGKALERAIIEELKVIEKANPQIVNRGGSGTYDLIYVGDKIAIPNAAQVPGVPPVAGAIPGGVAVHGNQPGTVIPAGTVLHPGEFVLSPNGQFKLIMQTDGNLVIYKINPDKSEVPYYSTRTEKGNPYGRGVGDHAVVQADGNLVVYSNQPGGDIPQNAVWASNSNRPENTNSVLALQDDSNLVLYSATAPTWDAAHHNDKGTLRGN